jgi:hypothetical protein
MVNSVSTYKEEHEAFVSNLKGTSVGCVLVYLLHIPAFILLTKLTQRGRKIRILREFFFLVFPLLLEMTVFADYNYLSLIGLIVIIYVYYKTDQRSSHSTIDHSTTHTLQEKSPINHNHNHSINDI